MNKRTFLRSLAAALTSAMLSVGAYAAKPVQDVEGSPLPAGLSDQQIVKAIQKGGQTRGWVVKPVKPGHVEATIFVRSHMAKVDITYDKQSYAIRYKDSQNLGYENGRIHRNYNKWVQNLNMDIQRALAML